MTLLYCFLACIVSDKNFALFLSLSLVHNMFPLLYWLLLRFFLLSFFSNLIITWLGMPCFMYFCLEFVDDFDLWLFTFIKHEKNLAIFLQIFFSVSYSLSSSCTLMTHIYTTTYYPTTHWCFIYLFNL